MSPDLKFELLAITSIVSFLGMGGLLGLWAATSRWHWFGRAMVVVCLLALVQWRPLYELYLTLLVQVAVIVVGVAVYRREFWRWRFSVAGLLQVMVVAAVVLASLMREPEKEFTWQGALQGVGFGAVGGGLTLLGVWLVVTNVGWKWRSIVAIALVGLLGVGWYFTDLAQSIATYHGPVRSRPGQSIAPTAYLGQLIIAWACAVLPVVVFGILAAILSKSRQLAIVLSLLLAIFPGVLIFLLSTPLPVPPTQRPSAAYLKLMALADDPRIQSIESLLSVEEALINHAAVAQAVTTAEPVFDESWRLLEELIEQGGNVLEVNHKEFAARRLLIWMWTIRCEKSRKEGDSEETARILGLLWNYVDQLERPRTLGEATLDARSEVLTSVETYAAKEVLSRDDCVRLAHSIIRHNRGRTPWQELVQRQRVYDEHAFGWRGHWANLILRWSDPFKAYGHARWGSQTEAATISTLLASELALRAYYLENGLYPEKLEDLTTTLLPGVPIDPCSSTGEPLIYKKSDDGYVMYSRAYDLDDDGGRPPAEQYSWYEDGDLSLKEYFKD